METIQSFVSAGAQASLVVAHPGHELRLYGWLELVQPGVLVLTDGSGHGGKSRLKATSALLARVGAIPGRIFGAFTDRELYSAVIQREYHRLLGLVDQLAEQLRNPAIDYVVGDATEGYNPGHDVCRLLIDAAVALADRERAVRLGNFACKLSGSPLPPAAANAEDMLRLDDAMLARKIAAGLDYHELSGEVQAALTAFGQDSFRYEYLPPSKRAPWGQAAWTGKPYYERYGEEQVAAGHYSEVLRYEEHLRPLMIALQAHRASAVKGGKCAS
jgi:hypothetical protein